MIENLDLTSIEAIQTSFLVIAPAITIGLTQLIKSLLPYGKRYVNGGAVVIALFLSFLAYGFTVPAVFVGLVVGLSAIGLYDTGKNIINKQ